MCADSMPEALKIKNHITRAKRALQLSIVDQENALKIRYSLHQILHVPMSVNNTDVFGSNDFMMHFHAAHFKYISITSAVLA